MSPVCSISAGLISVSKPRLSADEAGSLSRIKKATRRLPDEKRHCEPHRGEAILSLAIDCHEAALPEVILGQGPRNPCKT